MVLASTYLLKLFFITAHGDFPSQFIKSKNNRDFPGGPEVKNLSFNAGDTGSIPVRELSIILHVMGQLSPGAPAEPEPETTELMLCNQRASHCREDPV